MIVGFGLVCACDDGPSAAEAERQRQETLLLAFVDRFCDAVAACDCPSSAFAAGCVGTESDLWRARLRAAEERDLVFDGECVDAIAEQAEAAGCETAPSGASHPCRDYCAVFHGDRELGDTCRAFDELVSNCEQGLVCSQGRCAEPCTVLSGAPLGARCRDPETGFALDDCADGLWCSPGVGRCVAPPEPGSPCPDAGCGPDSRCHWETNTCQPLPGLGESCLDSQCADDLDCVYDDFGYEATCREPAGLGESCNSVSCGEDLYCDELAVCRGPAALGESCRYVPCVTELVCDFQLGDTCREPPGVGQLCISGECADEAACDFTDGVGTCVAAAPDGEACMGHLECASEYCPRGFCEPRPGLGDDCSELFVCAEGLSCDGSTCRAATTAGPAICVYAGW